MRTKKLKKVLKRMVRHLYRGQDPINKSDFNAAFALLVRAVAFTKSNDINDGFILQHNRIRRVTIRLKSLKPIDILNMVTEICNYIKMSKWDMEYVVLFTPQIIARR